MPKLSQRVTLLFTPNGHISSYSQHASTVFIAYSIMTYNYVVEHTISSARNVDNEHRRKITVNTSK